MGQPKCHLAFPSKPETAPMRPDASRASPPAPVKTPVVSAKGAAGFPRSQLQLLDKGGNVTRENARETAQRGRPEARGPFPGGDRGTAATAPHAAHRRARGRLEGVAQHGDRLLERIGANDVPAHECCPSGLDGVDGRIVTRAGPRGVCASSLRTRQCATGQPRVRANRGHAVGCVNLTRPVYSAGSAA